MVPAQIGDLRHRSNFLLLEKVMRDIFLFFFSDMNLIHIFVAVAKIVFYLISSAKKKSFII